METRSASKIRLDAVQRHIIWKYFQPICNHIRIAEFPKSGGTWLSQMIAELTGYAFPRNTRLPMFKKCVQHSHIQGPTRYKTILIVRDARDVLTSAYFHFLISGKEKSRHAYDYWSNIMSDADIDNIEKSMPIFIERFHSNFKVSSTSINWSSHALSYLKNPNVVLVVRYEDLLLDTEEELSRVMSWLSLEAKSDVPSVVEKYSFENQTQRHRGQEDRSSFMRKGISGDWKNYFTIEAQEMADQLYGRVLAQLGYD